MIYNYKKFPLYSLFLLFNNTVSSPIIYSYNVHNHFDWYKMKPIFKYKTSVSRGGRSEDYLESEHIRKLFDNGEIFTGISDFIKYNNYIYIITPFMKLADYKCDSDSNKLISVVEQEELLKNGYVKKIINTDNSDEKDKKIDTCTKKEEQQSSNKTIKYTLDTCYKTNESLFQQINYNNIMMKELIEAISCDDIEQLKKENKTFVNRIDELTKENIELEHKLKTITSEIHSLSLLLKN